MGFSPSEVRTVGIFLGMSLRLRPRDIPRKVPTVPPSDGEKISFVHFGRREIHQIKVSDHFFYFYFEEKITPHSEVSNSRGRGHQSNINYYSTFVFSSNTVGITNKKTDNILGWEGGRWGEEKRK